LWLRFCKIPVEIRQSRFQCFLWIQNNELEFLLNKFNTSESNDAIKVYVQAFELRIHYFAVVWPQSKFSMDYQVSHEAKDTECIKLDNCSWFYWTM
jgi:hypothetical protein